MTNDVLEHTIVDTMFEAFKSQNLEQAVATVSDDTVWIHHGSQKLPSLRFEGKSGVTQFFATNFNTMHVEYFDILKTTQQGDTIVVQGKEKFTIDGEEGFFAQKWVQIYTVKNGLITRMEEFATSVADEEYMVVA
ncbi:nuclear transport factor 2 family protein [Acinetobacter shaoyimingii]|uniref:Nuclear transport factor 2 family protein n=1 Tax=Acinetobacter shaoyimingii TaxID=2715164 RepID=A0A6G8RRT8_9GAMM|nr:nuclear transport factor 2 family protein [Acinetobacter shaoyimingii]QIO04587.1 nuclear transport factor 2 family protein [Acinetobacter shaoyimingii]